MKFAQDLVLSGWMVSFLCMILHPQRVLRPIGIPEETYNLEAIKQMTSKSVLEDETVNEEENDTPMDVVKEEVLAVILQRFREPHLLKTEVLMQIGNGKMNKASKFISSIGYYNLVNMFRLEYARVYKEANPGAKQEEIALESGFVSRTAFYKAKGNVGEIDSNLAKRINQALKNKTD